MNDLDNLLNSQLNRNKQTSLYTICGFLLFIYIYKIVRLYLKYEERYLQIVPQILNVNK